MNEHLQDALMRKNPGRSGRNFFSPRTIIGALKKHLSPAAYRKLRKPLAFKRAVVNYLYDAANFISSARLGFTPDDERSYSALITMEYHKLEKARTLPRPRIRFGEAAANNILQLVETNLEFAATCIEDTATAVRVLDDYIGHLAANGLDAQAKEFSARVWAIRDRLPALAEAGATVSAGILPGGRAAADPGQRYLDFLELMKQRKSIRNFSDAPVPREWVLGAVEAAKYAPSVCNRQPWQVHYLDDREKIAAALKFQNGNSGFGDTVPVLLVVTSSPKYFPLSGERNQAWIDGGMFSMSLLLSLTASGLASCALNWGTDSFVDRAAKRAIGIAPTDNIIMMIAVGHAADGHHVCVSQRRSTSRFVRFVGSEPAGSRASIN